MEFLFGKRKSFQDQLKQHQRALNSTVRELDRERHVLERRESKLISDLKIMAKKDQIEAVKVLANDLVQTRRYVKKFMALRANVSAISLRLQAIRSQEAMSQSMRELTRIMIRMNTSLKLPQLQKIMVEFEKQNETMELKEELMNDTIDELADENGFGEDESDKIVCQVLDELGIQISEELGALASDDVRKSSPLKTGSKKAVAAEASTTTVDLELANRLENLKQR